MNLILNIGHKWSCLLSRTPKACITQGNCRAALEKNRQEHNKHVDILLPDQINDEANNCSFPPLVRALKALAEENAASFDFPGHNRGQAAPSSLAQLIGTKPFHHDLQELDNLFAPVGPILEAQNLASELFGASETWFLVGGTTCGIQASIMGTCSHGDTLILPRNSHISAVSAMVLSGVVPKYVLPEYDPKWDIAGGITTLQVEGAIKELQKEGRKPAAVFVTSPSYHGICSDISAISKVCHYYKIPLIVDEAHGAHFGFHEHLPRSALAQGADLVVQSTHKVLCSLTQSSMLHVSGDLIDKGRIRQCLQTLQSTSPSALLLASLDAARAQLSENPETIFNKAIELASEAKSMIKNIHGISLLNSSTFAKFPVIDPLRVTIGMWQLRLSGFEADDILSRDFGIVSELVGTQSITLPFNLGTKRGHVLRLVSGLKYLSSTFLSSSSSIDNTSDLYIFDSVDMTLTPREAFFARKRKVSIEESVNKICGELICPYPPGIPVLIPGEVITEKALKYLLHVKGKGAAINGASDPLLTSIVVCDA